MSIRFLVFIMVLGLCQTCNAKQLNGFDISNSLIPTDDIVHGGPPRDGIPAIFNPIYLDASDASFMRPKDVILGLELGGMALAFPRHILNWHELVNDRVDDIPFVVSYCPLCGTGMAFSSKVGEDDLVFGVSGLLYNSDIIFYDKTTESLWSQLEARAISGKYVGKELQQLYLQTTTWASWLAQFPKTKVLGESQGVKRNYRHDPYSGYDTSSQLFFKTLREAPKTFHTKERVLGVTIGNTSKAYPFVELRRQGLSEFIDQVEGINYRVRWDKAHESASIESVAGEKITSTVAFWFAWYNFNPKTLVYRADLFER